jgi:hypothetical protein
MTDALETQSKKYCPKKLSKWTMTKGLRSEGLTCTVCIMWAQKNVGVL